MLGRDALLSVAFWGVFLGVLRVGVVPPESCGNDTVAAIGAAAHEAIGWMERNQQPDGSFVYEYDTDTDTVSRDYNEVRHAGVTMALYQAAGRFPYVDALRAADRGLAWMRERLVRRHGWAALAPGDTASLGATALMTVGLTERRLATGDAQYDPLLRELGQFMTALQRDDGGFYMAWDIGPDQPEYEGTSRYFPGEALWALTLLAKAFPGEGWDAPARRAAGFIATKRDDVEEIDFPPLADQWAAYGLAEMSSWGLTDGEIDYARSLAERFGFLVRVESQRQGSFIGRIVRGREARGAGAGTWVEALAALWRLSATDSRLADMRPKIEERLRCIGGIMAERQVSAEEAAGYPRPDLVRGAWVRGGDTRMDDQQHTISGLLYTLDALNGRTQREPDTRIAVAP